MTQRFNQTVNGDFRSVGNGVLECDSSKPVYTTPTTCAGLHSGATNSYNDYGWMKLVDVDDDDATFNSSSASVTVPTGAVVVKAQLYWSGNTGVVKGSTGVKCSSNGLNGKPGYVAPSGAPATTSPRLSVGGSAYRTVAVGNYYTENDSQLTGNQPQYYSASQDVTGAFSNITTGSAQTVTVGNIWAPQGYGCYGGWSLSVVFDFGSFSPSNPDSAARDVIIYDGHVRKFSGESAENVTFNGFTAQAAGARASFTLYEGDRAITGDTAKYTTSSTPTATEITNAYGEKGNIGVSVADGQVPFPGRSTPFNNASVDVRSVDLTGLKANDKSATFSMATTGDSYLLQDVVMSVPTAAVRIDKSFNGTDDTQTIAAGSKPSYTIKVSNAGSSPLTSVAVTDAQAPGCARTIGAMPVAPASGSVVTYTCDGPATSAGLENSASVTGSTATGATVNWTDTTQVKVANIAVTKTASPAVVQAGGKTTWTVTVINSGDVALTGVTVSDSQVPDCAGTIGDLAVGASKDLTCTSTVDGGIDNTAEATGTAKDNSAVTVDASADARADSAAIRLVKATSGAVTDVNNNSSQDAGDTLDYTFTVYNGGSVPLTGVAVDDKLIGPVSCPTSIPVGKSVTCTATYTITQDDVDSGSVKNTATASGSGRGVQVDSSSSTTTPLSSATAVDVVKSAGRVHDAAGNPIPTGQGQAGDLINYTFKITNTGSTTLSDFSLDDPKLGTATITCKAAKLAPDASTTCGPVSYVLTQADINASTVDNTVTVDATGSTGEKVQDESSVTTPLDTEGGSLQVIKTAGPIDDVDGNGYDAGDTIGYTFTVTNTGNTTLFDLQLSDPMFDKISCDDGPLVPGAEVTCTAGDHTITQDEIDKAQISNEVTATAEDPQGNPVTDKSQQDVTVTGQSLISLKKTGAAIPANPKAGDTVAYTFTITNTGATTLHGVQVDDLDLDVSPTCSPATLAPGEKATCGPVDYKLTQADIDGGRVINTATTTATSATGVDVTATDTAINPIQRDPSMLATKTAGDIVDANKSGALDAGDTVAYSFTVQNTGSATLRQVSVSDPMLGSDPVSCTPATLVPGRTATCGPVTYTLTQADIDHRSVTNTATATATEPGGTTLTDKPTATVLIDADGGLKLTKTVGDIDDNDDDGPDAGDTTTYSFTVTNTGATTVSGLSLTDDLLGGQVDCGTDFATASLAPGKSIDCGPISYTLTQNDVDAGSVTNTATVAGHDSRGQLSDKDSADLPIDARSSVKLVKTGTYVDSNDNGHVDPADSIRYTFTVTNTGTTTLTVPSVDDSQLGGAVDCEPTTLPPAATAVCGPATYRLTQADINHGRVDNHATVTGVPKNGHAPVSATDEATVELKTDPSIELVKTTGDITDTDDDGTVDAGDAVDYIFTVTNTGNTTVTDVTVQDSKIDTVDCPSGDVAPGDKVTCHGSYTLTVDDITTGHVDNTATADAKGAGGSPDPAQASDKVTKNLPQSNAIELIKTASQVQDDSGTPVSDGQIKAGDRIIYSFTVTNTGTTRIAGLQVSDTTMPNAQLTCADTTLDPRATTDCGTATHILTQDEVDAGIFVNDATATGHVDTTDGVDVSDDATAPRAFNGHSALGLQKSNGGVVDANGNGRTDAGDTVDYTFTVTNAGTRTVRDVSVSDPRISKDPISCDPATLKPGDDTTCGPVTYKLTQDDIDAGGLTNTAAAHGTDPNGDDVTSPDDSSSVEYAAGSQLDLVKHAGEITDANDSGRTDAGDTIAYTFTVTNSGATTVHDVTVTDTNLSGTISCDATQLAPGDKTTCHAAEPYALTQADVDAGQVSNTATANAEPPSGGTPPAGATDTVDVPVDQDPDVTLVKSAGAVTDTNSSGRTDAGDTIRYSFTVTNSGTTTLTSIQVKDPLLGDDPIACDIPADGLAPGASMSCTAQNYVLKQADVDAQQVTNTANVSGQDAAGHPVTDKSSTSTDLDVVSGLKLDKHAGDVQDANDSGRLDAGDTIEYGFTVTNTGATTIDTVTLTDELAEDPISCGDFPADGLAPGAKVDCDTFTYVLTQADIEAAVVINHADLTGKGPGPDPDPADDSTRTDLPVVPQITVTKSAGAVQDANHNNRTDAGDTIAYTVTVTNTGVQTVRKLKVTDQLLGGALECDKADLLPGKTVTCTTVDYRLTQDDIDAGFVDNTASGSGVAGPDDSPVSDSAAIHTPVTAGPAVTLTKTAGAIADSNDNGRTDAGDTVRYEFKITNTGSTTLTSAQVRDPNLGSDPIACDLGSGLAPGKSVDCKAAEYTLTQKDVDTGRVKNVATVDASDPRDQTAEGTDTSVVTIPPVSTVALDKSAGAVVDANESGRTDAGDTIRYSFTVTNTGTTTLTSLQVKDPLLGDEPISCEVPQAGLAPGATLACTAKTYTLTQADVDRQKVSNTATVTGDDPSDDPVTDKSSTTTDLDVASALKLSKHAGQILDANASGVVDAGDTITYGFTVTNTGATTIDKITVTDELADHAIDCDAFPADGLAPGASVNCSTFTYTLTQADIDAGQVTNHATTTGKSPGPDPDPADDLTHTDLPVTPQITVAKSAGKVKDANQDGRTDSGDTIAYTVSVTNTGVQTVHDLKVSDPLLGGTLDCHPTSLAPGDTVTCTVVDYTLTQDDIDAGYVDNTATATGVAGTGNTSVSDKASVHTPITAGPAVTLTKTVGSVTDANGSGRTDAGDTVRYEFTITNTGTTTLTTAQILDPNLGDDPIACDLGTGLQPGKIATCNSADYAITQADVDAGQVTNTATTTVSDRHDHKATGTDTAIVVIPPNGQLALVKTADDPVDTNNDGLVDAGDSIVYHFAVTNTGATSVSKVTIDDPKLAQAGVKIICADKNLAPGAKTTCTAEAYQITDDDQAAGSVHNIATASGHTPDGGKITSPTAATDTPLTAPQPALGLKKSVTDANNNGKAEPGEKLSYTFTVTNTGNVALHATAIDDPMLEAADTATSCPGGILKPGDSISCTASYTVRDHDIAATKITNHATARADTVATGPEVHSDPATATIQTDAGPGDPAPSSAPSDSTSAPADPGVSDNGGGLAGTGAPGALAALALLGILALAGGTWAVARSRRHR